MGDEDIEFLPLLPFDDGEEGESPPDAYNDILPLLPLRNTVLFPEVVIPITVGREKSMRAVKAANNADKFIAVVAQKDAGVENPTEADLYRTGTIARIVKMLKMPDSGTTVILQGRKRFVIEEFIAEKGQLKARIKVLPSVPPPKDNEFKAIISTIKDLSGQIISLSPNIPSEAGVVLRNIDKPDFLVHFISSNLNIGIAEKQELLETEDPRKRAVQVLKYLNTELQMAELKNQIQSKVRTDIDKQQRDYFLHQQLKTIQEELGNESYEGDIEDLKMRGLKKKWTKEVNDTFTKELKRLQRMNPALPEYSMSVNYLELLLDLPWNEYTTDNFDLKRCQQILDKDHYGLEKVKKRILEYLAVLKLKGDMKAPILCFIGPPGVGKTSLGKSIAKALKRKYVRMSLGGLHDEAEIRGHRRTYIGAMPGRIIQSVRKSKSGNPLFILDEIDKVGSDFRGDPSSALLEVLDPEQNSTFYDNYLELEYDLSKVLFIATANSLATMHPALLDRMEIIEISGYSVEEKIEIAKRHLLPRQREAHGLQSKQINITPSVLTKLINEYTRESGVRELERKIAALMRATAKMVAMEEDYNPRLNAEDVVRILGAPVYDRDLYQNDNPPGVAVGLAWTQTGGDILFIECILSKGKGRLTLTGNLGDVMKESVTTALSYLRAHAETMQLDPDVFDNTDVHVHVPEGAIPKDGPSAGITMLTALTSAFTKRSVKPYLAMTGEITLRGKVLPVGGIKEKILAAKRAGITTIILSHANQKDVNEINAQYIEGITFHYVKEMQEVLAISLEKQQN
ncbi:endopeptidase La [Sphingobacteriales bacterium UPWRP_1]|nr:endopeptidase La [Sphingobacteriales bacterium TSM_CSS]PSJ75312.1 endopeptidase La [Sphingobacteriales bacterium UPWRP_1]